MSDTDIDYGLLVGSTNDEIWDEEAAKTAGGRAMRKAMLKCDSRLCHATPRQHFQSAFDDPVFAEAVCEVLAPYEHETPAQLTERLIDYGREGVDLILSEGLGEAVQRVAAQGGGLPRMGVLRIGPDGIATMGEMPPQVRALFEALMGKPEDDPVDPPPPGAVRH